MPLTVQIVTAEREVYSQGGVAMVVAPGSEGVLGILPRHAPLLTTLSPGIIRVQKEGQEESMSISGGFLQVARDRVLVLADTAERAEEVDQQRAEAARERARAALAEAQRSGQRVQVEAARFKLRREEARIEVTHRRRRRDPRPGA
jgi:F-type H+-transporting ATPase subunit epsilon